MPRSTLRPWRWFARPSRFPRSRPESRKDRSVLRSPWRLRFARAYYIAATVDSPRFASRKVAVDATQRIRGESPRSDLPRKRDRRQFSRARGSTETPVHRPFKRSSLVRQSSTNRKANSTAADRPSDQWMPIDCAEHADRDAAEGAHAEAGHVEQADDAAADVGGRIQLHQGLRHRVERQFEEAAANSSTSASG